MGQIIQEQDPGCTPAYRKQLNTNFGTILIGKEGDVMLPPGIWQKMVSILANSKNEGRQKFLNFGGWKGIL